MADHHGAVLMVDGDIGFLFVLAHELSPRGISLIPSDSVRKARSMLVKLNPKIDVLIVNCRIPGVCALTAEMVGQNAKLEVIGIVSGNHQCSSCRKLLTMVSQDPELREAPWIRRLANLIQSRVSTKRKAAFITDPQSES
jgi:hypothetical protein